MGVHLQHEVDKLKKMILTLGSRVESSFRDAVISVQQSDWDLAQDVIQRDSQTDLMEVDVEEEALKILALHQPVATDLRFIIAVLKINRELERIGDLASNIAERGISLTRYPECPFRPDFTEMAQAAKEMLRKSLDALVNLDIEEASTVRSLDDVVDDLNRRMYDEIQAEIKKHPEQVDPLIHLLSTARHIERIADLATNISEEIIYMVKGRIVRHTAKGTGSYGPL